MSDQPTPVPLAWTVVDRPSRYGGYDGQPDTKWGVFLDGPDGAIEHHTLRDDGLMARGRAGFPDYEGGVRAEAAVALLEAARHPAFLEAVEREVLRRGQVLYEKLKDIVL